MRLTLVPTAVVSADDFETAFMSMRGIDAVIVLGGPPFGGAQCGRMVDLQNRTSIPLLGLCTASGGLASYFPDSQEMTRQIAIYVDKILRGKRPGDLPVQQPTQFDLKLNASTARRFGLAIPSEVLLRAQELVK
jgi:putative ABC transport system substrate-binding protein